ncbi:hypothetical protein A2239_00320 [Candidatus Uhrbacteria bacterium RIFOXYA2_FULL_40_9]|nr:MAG: hypothetical protein UT94_C0034G0024 [Candidatus Uhrbacteria bacterium GW2011_GWF2_40_263]OGL93863.1 MAG: hypothetical protein A2239_00320 [Candidatus Uhrbacteria bacterium RIFOXYA2_FULL_40_9]OGL97572.1 MAG: hypothetical protein A2332_03495 [Candidatus Uhrbacteria bacterium RIFOXYB2_FULL_41_18]HBK34889.1 hypothetical protein [Candidatus Uhrbacteria bacterium]HCB56093.1 hypothetical protein [Candidatus Uhrbacteria bacterium]
MSTHHHRTHFFRSSKFSFKHLTSTEGLATLTINRMISVLGWSLIGLFYPIFIYEYFHQSLVIVLLYFAITFAVRIPLFWVGAKIFSRIGLVASMIIGEIGATFALFAFYALETGIFSIPPSAFLLFAIIGFAIDSMFYWSPFHVDFIKMSTKGKLGRQISVRYAIQSVISVLAPLISGWIILHHGYEFNFLFGVLITITSIIPLLFLKNTFVQYEFGFWETFQKMFESKFRSMSISMMAYGAESVVGTVIWPLFLFIIFQGDYLNIGSFAAVIIVMSLLLELFIGKETDKFSAVKMLKIGTGVYALGWIGKAIVDTVVGVFAASTFHSIGSILLRTPMDTLMYEQAADCGHYIDEYTTLREIALTIGRAGMMFFLIALTYWFSISSAFLVAAVISIFVLRIARQSFSPVEG